MFALGMLDINVEMYSKKNKLKLIWIQLETVVQHPLTESKNHDLNQLRAVQLQPCNILSSSSRMARSIVSIALLKSNIPRNVTSLQ